MIQFTISLDNRLFVQNDCNDVSPRQVTELSSVYIFIKRGPSMAAYGIIHTAVIGPSLLIIGIDIMIDGISRYRLARQSNPQLLRFCAHISYGY